MQGLAQTRQSVQRLNAKVVQALIEQGVNAVALSPCFGALNILPKTRKRISDGEESEESLSSSILRALCTTVESTLRAGLVPVLHGDACLYRGNNDDDDEGGEVGTATAVILSGDTLLEWLGSAPWVSRAIFLTDVDGVHTHDPKSDPKARLLREIAVSRDPKNAGEFVEMDGEHIEASGSKHDHDVTGGLQVRNDEYRGPVVAQLEKGKFSQFRYAADEAIRCCCHCS